LKEITVVPFDPKYISAFSELNRQWIEKYFELEPADSGQLENPYTSIVEPGGEIFFLLEDGRPLGTCAMIAHEKNSYELGKMAVSPRARGQGYGDLLMRAALAWAKSRGAQTIRLHSNTVLEPAISLYHKYGFKTVHLGDHPDYKRSNIIMELSL
jgi:GNAT superfamily N-acetyltransferase